MSADAPALPGLQAPERTPSRVERWCAGRYSSHYVSALCFLIFGSWWLAFYPAISTVDSDQSWSQAHMWLFQDWHPVFYTWTIAVLVRTWNSPAIVTATQLLCFVAVLGGLHRRLLRLGVPALLAFITPVLIALSPQTGLTSMTMWKDVPFAIAVLWMFTEVLDVVADSKRYFASWGRCLRLAGSLTAVILYRHNGKLLVAGVGLALLICCRAYWRRVAVAGAATLVVYGLVTGPMYSYLNVWPSPAMFTYTVFLHDMAAVVNEHEADLPAADRAFLNSILPINRWKAKTADNPDGLFFCRQATPLIFPPEFYPKMRLDRDGKLVPAASLPLVFRQNSESVFLEQHKSEFRALWIRSLKRWPGTIFRQRRCVGSLAWNPGYHGKIQVLRPPFESTVTTPQLVMKPKSMALRRFWLEPLRWWDFPNIRFLTWHAATWCYLGFISVAAVAWRRRNWRFLLAGASGFAAWFSVLTFTPGQSSRYMFPAYLCGLATLPVIALAFRGRPALDTDGGATTPGADEPTAASEPTGGSDPTDAIVADELEPALAGDPENSTAPIPGPVS